MSQNSPKKSKRPERYITESIIVEKLVPGGQALATLADGKKIFLWNALPGEVITETRLTKAKSTYLEGIATKVAEKSAFRTEPHDACYLSTSPWQIMTYDYELSQKSALLREVFRQHKIVFSNTSTTYAPQAGTSDLDQFDLPIDPIQTDQRDYHYRNKMEYALYYDHGDQLIYLAFHARGSHQKLIAETSSIERPELFARAQAIIADLNSRHEEARKYQSLLLRCNQSGEVSGGLFENHQPRPQFPNLTDQILGQLYSYSPNGFFQINLPVYEMALREIKPWIKTTKVLDLYAGVGTIGLSVACDRDLILVECDKSAYREMTQNCHGTSAQPILAKSEEALEYVQTDQTVIVDPPRAGCRPELLAKFLEVTPQTIIYLSCNPATQARDTKILLEKYQIVKIAPFNFFPRTPHLENLLILERIHSE